VDACGIGRVVHRVDELVPGTGHVESERLDVSEAIEKSLPFHIGQYPHLKSHLVCHDPLRSQRRCETTNGHPTPTADEAGQHTAGWNQALRAGDPGRTPAPRSGWRFPANPTRRGSTPTDRVATQGLDQRSRGVKAVLSGPLDILKPHSTPGQEVVSGTLSCLVGERLFSILAGSQAGRFSPRY
jgi:hypothetical protein